MSPASEHDGEGGELEHGDGAGDGVHRDWVRLGQATDELALPPERVMLHAEHIVFRHPVSGKTLDLHAPLPKDFERQLTGLRQAAGAATKARRLASVPPKTRKRAAPPAAHEHESRT